MESKLIKAIIFDLGNVILNFDHKIACKRLSERSSFSSEYIYNYIFNNYLEELYDKGKISSNKFYRTICKSLGIKISYQEFYEIWGDIFWLNPGMDKILKSLKKKTKIALLSNTNEIHFSYVKKKFNILKEIDEFILSFKIGARKPEDEIFLYALKKIKLPPKNVLYVDDIIKFVKVAEKIGFNGIVFSSPAQLENDLKEYNLRK